MGSPVLVRMPGWEVKYFLLILIWNSCTRGDDTTSEIVGTDDALKFEYNPESHVVMVQDGKAKISKHEMAKLFGESDSPLLDTKTAHFKLINGGVRKVSKELTKIPKQPTIKEVAEKKIWIQQNEVSAIQGNRDKQATDMMNKWMAAHNVNCTMKIAGQLSSKCESARKAITTYLDKRLEILSKKGSPRLRSGAHTPKQPSHHSPNPIHHSSKRPSHPHTKSSLKHPKMRRRSMVPEVISDGIADITGTELEELYAQVTGDQQTVNGNTENAAVLGEQDVLANAMKQKWMEAHNVNCTTEIGQLVCAVLNQDD